MIYEEIILKVADCWKIAWKLQKAALKDKLKGYVFGEQKVEGLHTWF